MGIRYEIKLSNVHKVDELAYAKKQADYWAKEYARLKTEVDAIIGNDEGIQTDNVLVMKKPVTRTSIDKAALLVEVGQSLVDKVSKSTTYFTWQITAVGS